MAIRFSGRVVLVTGAGGGLGREYALEFARRGASVVVNDLGGSRHGDGQDQKTADHVVKDIRSFGGKAVANYDSVEDGEKIVNTALNGYGRIDIVVNNAGIIRDRSFAKMTEQDWDLVHKVHLKGAFSVTKAAWPHFKKQKFGRILMTTSAAGLYGNFGQANYGSAKLGLLGLSKTLAVEGASSNIFCNTIAPLAASRLTQDILPTDILESVKPKYITPLVIYLTHEDCQENGGLFELAAGWIGKLQWQRSDGAYIQHGHDENITAEQVRDNWETISDFSSSHSPQTTQESMEHLMKFIPPANQNSLVSARNTKPQETTDHFPSSDVFNYTPRDAILYALGVGTSLSQPDSLKYLYEGAPDFAILPTFLTIPCLTSINSLSSDIPNVSIDPSKVVHGEHYLEIYKPLSPSGSFTNHAELIDVLDKTSSASLIYNVTTFDENGEKVAFNQLNVVSPGSGNFGGKRTSPHAYLIVSTPTRPADASVIEKTSLDQAALYRLSGDSNPLHIDPEIAQFAGFSSPIVHGLCSLGFAVRAVIEKFCKNDPSCIKSVKVRFSKPVYPGQTLQTDMWTDGNRILFLSKVMETGDICLTGGCVEMSKNVSDLSKGPILASDSIFEDMRVKLISNPAIVTKVKAVFIWDITTDGKLATQWTTDFKNGNGLVERGEHAKADCRLTLSDEDLVAMATGKLNPQQAFMKGKLKLSGNMMLAQKLSQLFQNKAKL